MKISCVTPSVRPELIGIVKKCLARQTFRDFEWIIVTNDVDKMTEAVGEANNMDVTILEEPPKREGDFYSLNKSYNHGIRHSQGELFVSIQDGVWFEPDLLQKFWDHYHDMPKVCVTAIGHQYDQVKNGKPENLIWHDPRAGTQKEVFYEIWPKDMEFCVASVPMKALYEVGGFDETYDKYAALSEKDLCVRLDRRDYHFFIDNGIEYRAIHHERLSKDWDDHYNKGFVYFQNRLKEISAEKGIKLNYL